MSLARVSNHYWFDPFRELAPLVNEIFHEAPQAPTWAPPVDVLEKADGVELVADLPGMVQADIGLSVEKGILTIRAERKAPAKDESTTCRTERPHGVFERTFTLGDELDPEKIEARYEAGVLHVTIAKKPQVQPRRIEVSVAS